MSFKIICEVLPGIPLPVLNIIKDYSVCEECKKVKSLLLNRLRNNRTIRSTASIDYDYTCRLHVYLRYDGLLDIDYEQECGSIFPEETGYITKTTVDTFVMIMAHRLELENLFQTYHIKSMVFDPDNWHQHQTVSRYKSKYYAFADLVGINMRHDLLNEDPYDMYEDCI
jgi:hypothetical protein